MTYYQNGRIVDFIEIEIPFNTINFSNNKNMKLIETQIRDCSNVGEQIFKGLTGEIASFIFMHKSSMEEMGINNNYKLDSGYIIEVVNYNNDGIYLQHEISLIYHSPLECLIIYGAKNERYKRFELYRK